MSESSQRGWTHAVTPDPGVRPDLRIPERRLWAKSADGQVTSVSIFISEMSPNDILPGAVDIRVRIAPILEASLAYTRLPYEEEFVTVLRLLRLCESSLRGLERQGWSFFREATCQMPYRVGDWLVHLDSDAPRLGVEGGREAHLRP